MDTKTSGLKGLPKPNLGTSIIGASEDGIAEVRKGLLYFQLPNLRFLHVPPPPPSPCTRSSHFSQLSSSALLLKRPETKGTAATCAANLSKVQAVTAALLFRARGLWRASTYKAVPSLPLLKAAPLCASSTSRTRIRWTPHRTSRGRLSLGERAADTSEDSSRSLSYAPVQLLRLLRWRLSGLEIPLMALQKQGLHIERVPQSHSLLEALSKHSVC